MGPICRPNPNILSEGGNMLVRVVHAQGQNRPKPGSVTICSSAPPRVHRLLPPPEKLGRGPLPSPRACHVATGILSNSLNGKRRSSQHHTGEDFPLRLPVSQKVFYAWHVLHQQVFVSHAGCSHLSLDYTDCGTIQASVGLRGVFSSEHSSPWSVLVIKLARGADHARTC